MKSVSITQLHRIFHCRVNPGVALIVISAILFSTAGLFTKGVEAGSWEIIFWRGIFAAGFTTTWIANSGTLKQHFLAMGFSGVAVATVGALGTAAFIFSLKLTSIANVSLIYAMVPLIAAVIAFVVLGEKISGRMVVGCAGALAGVSIIVAGSLGADTLVTLSLKGDLMALFMTMAMATMMIIYRKYPATPSAGPAVLSAILLLPASVLLGNPFLIGFLEIGILGAFGMLFAIASITLVEGAKRVPAGRSALLSSLETPLAPVFAYLLFSEVPGPATLFGGSIVLLAVLYSVTGE